MSQFPLVAVMKHPGQQKLRQGNGLFQSVTWNSRQELGWIFCTAQEYLPAQLMVPPKEDWTN